MTIDEPIALERGRRQVLLDMEKYRIAEERRRLERTGRRLALMQGLFLGLSIGTSGTSLLFLLLT